MSSSRILLIGPYPPLYSYGGPTKSIYGIYSTLTDSEFSCKVLSPNKNLDGSNIEIISSNQDINYSNNFYLDFFKIARNVDLIWFNSFFEFKLILLLFFSKILRFKLIISPRGQLSDAAIKTSNTFIKKIFIALIRIFKSSLYFHSTSNSESDAIRNKINTSNIKCISNLFTLDFLGNTQDRSKYVFFSRIHKKKGLYFLLKTIYDNNINIDLDIYGFIEDKNYWKKCKILIDKLDNINYMGSIDNGDLQILKNKYSFFIFPTLNENFGHIIIELISLGIIPIISKSTTPFDSLLNEKIGLNFSLNSPLELSDVLNKTKQIDLDTLNVLKNSVFEIFTTLNKDQEAIKNDYSNFIKQLCK